MTSPTWLVASREIQTRLRTKSFIYSTLFTVVLFSLIAFVPGLLANSDPATIAVVDAQATAVVEAVSDPEMEAVPASDAAHAEQLVEDGEADAALVADGDSWTLITTPDTSSSIEPALTVALQAQASQAELARQGVDVAQLGAAVEAATPTVTVVGGEVADFTTIMVAFVISLLLFFQIFTYGNTVALGVIEEKSSRVVEVLLSTISARQLLTGKVLGIGIVGLLQLTIFLAVGAIGASIAGLVEFDAILMNAAVISVLWFIPGYLFYAFAYGAAGSLVSRQEEAGSVTAPLMVLIMASYFAAIFALQDLGATWFQVLSLIPPFSALLMPMRIAAGRAELGEVVLAGGLLAIATVAVALLGALIYERSVLRVGRRVRLSEAFARH
jgi:ABC-2 type transport system permease protein